MSTPKMYLLVRKDLEQTYRCVQATHALVLFFQRYPELFNEWNNGYLIFLGVQNLKALRVWAEKLSYVGKSFACYKELDLDEQMTAIACYDTGEVFSKLKVA